MPAKLKYHKVVKGYHYFQRAVPKDLRDAAKAAGIPNPFVKATGLTEYAPLAKVEEALAHWTSVYDDVVLMLSKSSTDQLEAETRTRLVVSYLEAKGYSAGQFAGADEDDETWEAMWSVLEDIFGDDLLQDHKQFKGKAKHGKEFIKTAIGALSSSEPTKRLTFTEAMNLYLERREKETSGDRLKKDVSYCHRFITAVGDHLLTTENAGRYLREYRNHLFDEGRRGSTVARMMSPVKAALNYAADTHCTDVYIPEIVVRGSTQNDKRYSLSETEIGKLVDLCTTPEYKVPDYVKLFYLIAVHSGAHMLEVRQTSLLDISDWCDGDMAIRIKGTKTDARERLVPILPEFIPFIDKLLPVEEGVSLLHHAGDVTDAAIDKALAKPVKAVNDKATPYSVRHGCKSLATAYKVDSALNAALFGWDDKTQSDHQKNYGLSGMAHDEQMRAKYDALQRTLQKSAKMLRQKAGE